MHVATTIAFLFARVQHHGGHKLPLYPLAKNPRNSVGLRVPLRLPGNAAGPPEHFRNDSPRVSSGVLAGSTAAQDFANRACAQVERYGIDADGPFSYGLRTAGLPITSCADPMAFPISRDGDAWLAQRQDSTDDIPIGIPVIGSDDLRDIP